VAGRGNSNHQMQEAVKGGDMHLLKSAGLRIDSGNL